MAEIDLKIKSRDIDTLVDTIRKNVKDADIDLIRRAYEYTEKSHRKQLRLSGEPYIIHPLEVAIILAGMGLDTTTIAAALLHDVVEDTGSTLEDMSRLFGEEIALLVDGVTKISSLKKQSKSIEQAHNLRKMLLATIKDVRVILIKLADKLHNMRTIMFQPEAKQKVIAQEVLDIYAPLAGRLGISKIRSELEDLAFHCLHHDDYHEIASKVVQQKQKTEEFLDSIRSVLMKKFEELKISAEITGRVKHYYSIYRKIRRQNKTFEDIFDIRAIRIITDEIRDCYGILGIIHTLWTPIASRFKDYIAVPKSNMYQSLHTTVIGPDSHPLEIQIRTREMHATAENGIAAHWLYKENQSGAREGYRDLTIIKNLDKLEEETDTREFMKELKMDLYEDEIFVFTPKGKIVKLASGSTPVDFAYAIHSEVGSHCTGARVNNVMVPLRTRLNSGDIVEIMTSAKGHPSESWLKFVRSSNARYKIRSYLRRTMEPDREKERREEASKPEQSVEVTIPDKDLIKIKKVNLKSRIGLTIDGNSNVLIKLSQCCQPIPGDDVVGFITRGRGITVHKKNCPSLKRMRVEKERFINIKWEEEYGANTYPVKLLVYGLDRPNLLKDLAEEISVCKSNILKVEARVVDNANAEFKMVLEVRNIEHLNDIIKHLRAIKSITRVYKLNEKVVLK
ncbi:MAG: bifunctional (p)ppGpp synthetase/guanosine-3',5'-bis(diphosphate) 3'-pyrophosphohydrolase [Deltaproteobacteria bacterium]|nr:MAG: bifunctional (p)ppGpp synthetase/guanosine-3',5'-bis(diphosphate) 3'-pyrophosphohydrolase [Deltaproteobacteria bacterium]